jgi:ribose transport system substrate-binding protein
VRNVSIVTRTGFALVCVILLTVNIRTNASAAEKIIIGFSQATMNSQWRVAMTEGNKKYAEEHYPDVDLVITDGENEPSKQISDVESLMKQGIKVLIISPVQAEPLTPIVQQVMQANIPVVTLDREVNTKVTCRIGAENRPIGVDAGKFIIKRLNGTGNVVEIEGTVGASATIGRHDRRPILRLPKGARDEVC